MSWKYMWHDHLCEYYNVTPEEALKLGTRSSGRKPNLPGSITCESVSNKTFEDIWESKERVFEKDIFDFYKEQGSWASFRQCVRHIDLKQSHIGFFDWFDRTGYLASFPNFINICEYGCGVAPFITTFLQETDNYIWEKNKKEINFILADVDSEHFNFAKYRLNKIVKDKKLTNINLEFVTIEPNKLPRN